ncbi:28312_t:CDS:2 [Dentiscutata erythropus]|uniref:28312_t:CDS:1 n=1 Tax=Dentiscutata erythropus TaxID=1348616 RepID=A0A9N8VKE5_9GLOM|nr:28312_t:CDS:2 [Dentiscutata erythropus]
MSILLSSRLLTTLKIIQLNNDKPPKIFRKALELSFFSRNARKRKIAVQLIQPLSSLGNKGYMRHRLYPNRFANYYIPRGPKENESEDGKKQIHLLAKGGQITLALYGQPYKSLNHSCHLIFERESARDPNDLSVLKSPVTREDIVDKIKESLGLSININDIEFHQDISKMIQNSGNHTCFVTFREIDYKVPLKVVVQSFADN